MHRDGWLRKRNDAFPNIYFRHTLWCSHNAAISIQTYVFMNIFNSPVLQRRVTISRDPALAIKANTEGDLNYWFVVNPRWKEFKIRQITIVNPGLGFEFACETKSVVFGYSWFHTAFSFRAEARSYSNACPALKHGAIEKTRGRFRWVGDSYYY